MRLLLTFAAAAAFAAAPAGFQFWKAADLNALEKTLAGKVNAQKFANQQFGLFDNHSMMMVYRVGDGEAEIHQTQTDVFFVRSGSGVLVIGGEVVGAKTTAPGEIRGPSIKGGERRPLAAGDMVNIPPKTAHQVLVPAGKTIGYAIVKVNAR